jgi:hypothetical protein
MCPQGITDHPHMQFAEACYLEVQLYRNKQAAIQADNDVAVCEAAKQGRKLPGYVCVLCLRSTFYLSQGRLS